MHAQARSLLTAAMPRALAAAARWARRVLRAARQARHYAAARRAFDRLDDATLRDLGIRRAEFDSYWAEAHALAPRTRRRVERLDHVDAWL